MAKDKRFSGLFKGEGASRGRIAALILMFLVSAAWLSLKPWGETRAAPVQNVDIQHLGWHVTGVDAIAPSMGPEAFMVGAEICNQDQVSAAADLDVKLVWNSTNTFIDLSQPISYTITTLPVNNCVDLYFPVEVTQDGSAIGENRDYYFEVSSGASAITSTLRQIDVVELFGTDALTTNAIEGLEEITVGQTYQYVVTSTTGVTGYEQLVHNLDLPAGAFRLVDVDASYEVPSGGTNDQVYADACGWQDDPLSANYMTCVGPPGEYTGGVVSGTLVTTYTVEVLESGTYTLTHLLYGYASSEDAYLFNSDYGVDQIVVEAMEPVQPTATLTGTQPLEPTLADYLPIIFVNYGTVLPTPTVTGTQRTPTPTRTPTRTGTIYPTARLGKTVSPTQAAINQTINFWVVVENTGSGPATGVKLTDNLSTYTYLDVESVTVTPDTDKTISNDNVTVDIGTLNPGDKYTVRINIRVNNTAPTGTRTVCNTANLSYKTGTTTRTLSSNRQCFSVVGSTTLPGTGELPIDFHYTEEGSVSKAPYPILGLFSLLLVGLWLSVRRKMGGSTSLRWLLGAGILLGTGLFVIWLTGMLPASDAGTNGDGINIEMGSEQGGIQDGPEASSPEPSATEHPLSVLPAYMFATPISNVHEPVETLPSYPIPSPTVASTPQPGVEQPDTSAIKRIVIPAMSLDGEVAYVPFDGQTWKIQGLREEIAWLGDTSWPGLGGNTGLAAHVTLRGIGNGPFRYLTELKNGAEVYLFTEQNQYTYKVRSSVVVEENDLTVLDQGDQSQITLITCVEWNEDAERYFKRLAVSADLVDVKSLEYSIP